MSLTYVIRSKRNIVELLHDYRCNSQKLIYNIAGSTVTVKCITGPPFALLFLRRIMRPAMICVGMTRRLIHQDNASPYYIVASVLQVNWLTRNNFLLSGTEVCVFTS
jgi:hypothetical protein